MISLDLGLWRSRTSGFNPLSLSPALWLDASDSATLFQSNGGSAAAADGDPVGYVLDKSGNSRHLTQTDSTKKPLLRTAIKNSKNIIRFDGVNDYINSSSFSVSQPNTIFLVFRDATLNNVTYYYHGLTNVQSFFGRNSGAFAYYAGGVDVVNCTTRSTSWGIHCAVFSGISTKIYFNASDITGTNDSTRPGALGVNGFNLGSAFNLSGFAAYDFAEAVIIPGAISDNNRTLMASYFNAKWGVY